LAGGPVPSAACQNWPSGFGGLFPVFFSVPEHIRLPKRARQFREGGACFRLFRVIRYAARPGAAPRDHEKNVQWEHGGMRLNVIFTTTRQTARNAGNYEDPASGSQERAYADRSDAKPDLLNTYGISVFVGFLAVCRVVEFSWQPISAMSRPKWLWGRRFGAVKAFDSLDSAVPAAEGGDPPGRVAPGDEGLAAGLEEVGGGRGVGPEADAQAG
jgi:hypothetical protein